MSYDPDNLTFTHRIIRAHTVDPLEGHTVVVLNKAADVGERFEFELVPGQIRDPKHRLFAWLRRRTHRYVAYAVAADPVLRTSMRVHVGVDDAVHEYAVNVEIEFNVSDPRTLVSRRAIDPLRELRQAAALALQRELAETPWLRVRQEFRRLASDVVERVLPKLRSFALQIGFEVSALHVALDVSSHDVAVETSEPLERALQNSATNIRSVSQLWDAVRSLEMLNELRLGDSSRKLLSAVPSRELAEPDDSHDLEAELWLVLSEHMRSLDGVVSDLRRLVQAATKELET